MAYDIAQVERIRALADPTLPERNVFGARCWMLQGNMAFGVTMEGLLLRLGPDVQAPGLVPFDPMGKGKPMKGWFTLPFSGASDEDLQSWMDRACQFTDSLEAKA